MTILQNLKHNYRQKFTAHGFDNMSAKEDIAWLRKHFNMRPIVPRVVKCLKCSRKFTSEDTYNQRLCDKCYTSVRSTQQYNETSPPG